MSFNMKSSWSKLSELKQIIILAVVIGVAISLLCLFGLLSNQPGWFYGSLIGTAVEIPCVILLFVGADFLLKKQKTLMFLLFYFLRMLLFGVGLLLPLVLEKYAGIAGFKYGIFGVLIAYTPTQIIAMFVAFRSEKRNEVKVPLGEKNE